MRWLVLLLLAIPLVPAVPVPTGEVEFHLYRDEAAAAYVASADPAAAYATGSWGSSANYVDGGRDWAFTFVDLDGPFRLDPNGMIAVTTVIGGGAQELGTADVAWQLIVGGAVVASGEAKNIRYVQQTIESTWSVAAPDVEIGNGDMFRVYTDGHIAKGARMDLEPSSLVLPVLRGSPGPAMAALPVSYEDVTGDVDRTFANETSISQLNWTIAGNGTVAVSWHLVGNVTLRAVSPGNQTAFDQNVTGQGNTTLPALAGLWNITLIAHNATGTIALRVVADGAPVGVDPPVEENTTTDPVQGTSDPAAKESPMPVLLLAAGLLVAAWRRR